MFMGQSTRSQRQTVGGLTNRDMDYELDSWMVGPSQLY
jgi:hypothetical protein